MIIKNNKSIYLYIKNCDNQKNIILAKYIGNKENILPNILILSRK